LTLTGTFTPGDMDKYSLTFTSESPNDSSAGLVVSLDSVTATSAVATLITYPGTSGLWKPVLNVANIAVSPQQTASRRFFVAQPPAPTMTGASGDCCTDSTKCVSGASLTISGTNFNKMTIGYTYVSFYSGDNNNNNVACDVQYSMPSTKHFICKLRFLAAFDSTKAAQYGVSVGVVFLNTSNPKLVLPSANAQGTFTFGGTGGSKGWSGNAAIIPNENQTPAEQGVSVTLIAVIIVGVLLIVVILGIVGMRVKGAASRRANVDMDYIEESFLPNNGENAINNERSGDVGVAGDGGAGSYTGVAMM